MTRRCTDAMGVIKLRALSRTVTAVKIDLGEWTPLPRAVGSLSNATTSDYYANIPGRIGKLYAAGFAPLSS